MPDDDEPGFGMKTATSRGNQSGLLRLLGTCFHGSAEKLRLRDYQRKHHAEVTALSQVVEAIAEMQAGPSGRHQPCWLMIRLGISYTVPGTHVFLGITH